MIYKGYKYRIQKDGYYYNGKHGFLHQVIWEYHNGKIPDGYVIHHKDENKLNNSIDNLQCLTKVEHQRLHHLGRIRSQETKLKMSNAKIGEKNCNAKLTEFQVWMIKGWLLGGFSNTSIAKTFNITKELVSMIKNNKRWQHVIFME